MHNTFNFNKMLKNVLIIINASCVYIKLIYSILYQPFIYFSTVHRHLFSIITLKNYV